MSRQKYFVKNRNFHNAEYRNGHAAAVVRDMDRQAAEKAELLDRMRRKNAPETQSNPFVTLLIDLAGVALGVTFWVIVLILIGVL